MIHALNSEVKARKKTFGGRHGAGTGKHCAGANTTGVWITLARGVQAELCIESTLAPELSTMSAFGAADAGVGARGLKTPARQGTGEAGVLEH